MFYYILEKMVEPTFWICSGHLMLSASVEAQSATRTYVYVDEVKAEKTVLAHGGLPSISSKERTWVLPLVGVTSLVGVTFGRYQGKTFKWLLENDVGWRACLVTSHQVG